MNPINLETSTPSKSNWYKKDLFQKRFAAMKEKHQRYVPAYQELSRYINPTRGIFDNNREKIGQMIDHQTLISSYATHANRIFASGLNSGMTNKSSTWFRLTIDPIQYLEYPGVREWLEIVQNILYAILNKSNLYDVYYSTYEELGQFGTGCFLILEDFEDVIRGRSFTAGEYYLATDHKGRVNAFAREFEMTVEQLVREFGLESCSATVKSHYQNNERDVKIKVRHLIEENDMRNPAYEDMRNMPYRSVYWEDGRDHDGFLAIRGFRKFRIVAPRWDVTTTDTIYGYGPGWHALGTIKELQKTRRDKLLAQEKYHNPPVVEDSSVDGHSNFLPGGVTKTSSTVPNSGVRAAYQINPAFDSFIELLNEEKEEIDRFFFVNLFLMLINVDKKNMTATEVAERQQEKIMMMGPALHRLDEEMLTTSLELIFEIVEEAGLIPPAPDAIQGLEIKIEYTSILAQAQKALGVTKIERVVAFAGSVAALDPSAGRHIINYDEAIRQVAEMEGASVKIINDDDVVDEIRAQEAQQQAMAAGMQMASVGADAVKKTATAPMGQNSALDRIMAGVSAAAGAGGGGG